MAAPILTTARLDELGKDGCTTFRGEEFNILLAMGREVHRLRSTGDPAVHELQAASKMQDERMSKLANTLNDSQQQLGEYKRDLGLAEGHVASLIRRHRLAIMRGDKIATEHNELVLQVHDCIDGKPLQELFERDVMFLRLQEALNAKNDE